MKKVLVLAYDFPPKISIGAQRPYSWYKYFNEFGLYPVVVTRCWSEEAPGEISSELPNEEMPEALSSVGKVIRADYRVNVRDKMLIKYGENGFSLIRRMFTLFYSILSFYSFKFDSTSSIFDEANEYLKNNKVDYILATGEPFILFRYASVLSKKHKIPWVADYRDCWTVDKLRNSTQIARILNSVFFKGLEKKYLSTVSFVTTASPSYKTKLSKLTSKKVKVIYNGYFEELHQESEVERVERFTISYAGTIYDYQPIELFMESLYDLDGKYEVDVNFYGVSRDKKEYLSKYSFDSININVFDKMPQNELIKKVKRSNMCLLLAHPIDVRLAAKVFDYLPLNIPILLVVDDEGILSSIVKETKSGISCRNKTDVTDAIKLTYSNWSEKIIPDKSENYEKYSRRNQAKELANMLLKIQ